VSIHHGWARGGGVLHDMLGDLRTSLRQLGRTPAFTAAAIAVLALGIGLNAAVFGLSHALVFAGRPFAAPDEIVQLYSRHAKETDSYRAFSHGAYRVIDERRDVFTGVAAHTMSMVGVRTSATADARRTFAGFVSANYFDVLGVPVAAGRPFTAEEARPGSQALVAIASDAYWRKSGANPALLGTTLSINERPVTIVGIAPPRLTGTMMVFGPELFLPLGAYDLLGGDLSRKAGQTLADPEAFDLFLVARLAAGVTPAAATARLGPTAAAVAEALPGQYLDRDLSVAALPRFGTSTSPSDEAVVRTLALVFLGMTAAVLLIVCLNLASVLVARGQARRREFAIRLALGGGRFRIVRQLMIEALLLGLAGAAGGVLLGVPALDAFIATLLSRLPVSLAVDAGTTSATLVGAFVFGVVGAVAFALGPALAQSGGHALADLKHQLGDDAPTSRRRWLKSPLVTIQVALSLALLVAAGLFVRLARDGTSVDVGNGAEATVLADADAGLAGFDEARALPLYAAVEARLAAMPDVAAASLGVTIPFGSVTFGESVRRAGTRPAAGERPATPEAGRSFDATWNAVGAGYPQAMGLRLLQGRTFTDAEALRQGAPRVAIVNQALAARLWPGGEALGQSIHIGDDAVPAGPAPESVEIVGIVSVLPEDLFGKEPRGAVYVPFAQGYRSGMYFHVRPRPGAPDGFADRVRATIQAAAPALPLFGVTTYGAHLTTSIEFWGLKTLASVVTSVGAFAALIALIGVYGAKSYAVSRRAREIGVRLAVGASPASVRTMIVGEALAVGGVGVAIGSVLGLGVGRVLDTLFVDLVSFDAWLFTLAPLLLLAACGLAAWAPARRAANIDPSTALRAD